MGRDDADGGRGEPGPGAPPAGLRIEIDDARRAPVAALLARHAAHAEANSPPGSCHYFDAGRLTRSDITLWTARADGAVLGCVALQERPGRSPDEREGELKSLHVAEAARGRGIGRVLVETVLSAARARGLARVRLETGGSPGFAASRALYAATGFTVCGPFADYADNGFSVFMVRAL